MNYYEIFGLAVTYNVDDGQLTRSYLEKQRKIHPDASGGEANSEISSSLLNIAYQTLVDPIKRAEYFLKLQQEDIDFESSQNAVKMFEIREQYDSLSTTEDRKKFQEYLQKTVSQLSTSLFNTGVNILEFREIFCLLRFISAFLEKIKSDAYTRN